MTSPQAPPAERKSECTVCPPWVVACAHFEGQILVLTDCTLNNHTCASKSVTTGFEVASGIGIVRCGSCAANVLERGNGGVASFPDLPSAQAEFDRRAAELRAQ